MKRFTEKYKRIIVFALCFMIAFPAMGFMTGCGDRTTVLKVYNWGEYIADGVDSMDVISEFETWYEEKTGESIRVEYSMFDTNETMYTQIANKRADYDVVCPSDYTVQKMLTNDLLLPLGDDEFDEVWADAFSDEDPETYGLDEGEEITYRNIMRPSLTELVATYDEGWSTGGVVYSVPYMWGTFGLLYDLPEIESLGGSAEDMNSWEALFGSKYSGHIYMKNSVRDAYASANIYNYTDMLRELSDNWTNYGEEYHALLAQCMNYPNDETIASAEKTLKDQKKHLYAYESDEGKEDLKNGKSAAALGFVWSCDAGYVIGMEENTGLWYTVPVEGTNVWVDSMCIPKYAGNVKAAKYFIAFLNMYNVAYENMYWVGAATPVASAAEDIVEEINDPRSLYVAELEEEGMTAEEAIEEWEALVLDALSDSETASESYDALSEYVYFIDKYLEYHDDCTDESDCDCDWHAYARMYSECLYPSDGHVDRAAIMTDFAEKNIDIVRMFTRVKAG